MSIYIYSLIGWIGMTLIIFSYLLLTTKKLKSSSIIYHFLNLIGAAGIIIGTLFTKLWPATILSVILAIVAAYAVYKIIKTKPEYKELK